MSTSLSKEQRKLLEKVTADARALAESACRAALENLAVHEKEYRGHMNVEQRLLRNRLRARGRALGDQRDPRTGIQDIHHLVELAAYEHWHRLLFTRFLTENNLLITDEANGNRPRDFGGMRRTRAGTRRPRWLRSRLPICQSHTSRRFSTRRPGT